MYEGQDIVIFKDWFILHFIENNGIAFGMEWGGRTGKLFLTLFRIAAVSVIGYFIIRLIKKESAMGLVLSVALIFAGALGNIIDSVFYGPIFGYENFFYGKVVDMLYFPVYHDFLPEWIPFVGGDYFIFFRPVFNIADTAITTGVFAILLFYRKLFSEL